MSSLSVTAPGTRGDWRLCRNRVEPGQVRCDECAQMLADHPDATVRRMLASEDALPRNIVEILVTDGDSVVQDLAELALRALDEYEGGR